ncbi:MAG TPA: hypothetical protein VGI45_33160 [Terracidiphilus sp.]
MSVATNGHVIVLELVKMVIFRVPMIKRAAPLIATITVAVGTLGAGAQSGSWAAPRPAEQLQGKPYTAVEKTTEVHVVNGVAIATIVGTTLVARDEKGRSAAVLFPSVRSRVPLSIIITDPVSHTRIHLDPLVKKAFLMPDWHPPHKALSTRLALDHMKAQAGVSCSPEKEEALPPRFINGLKVQGVRDICRPKGQSGEAPAMEAVSELWWSSDLDAEVLSTHFDAKSGESITELTNIDRRSPDLSLFNIPHGYTVVEVSSF